MGTTQEDMVAAVLAGLGRSTPFVASTASDARSEDVKPPEQTTARTTAEAQPSPQEDHSNDSVSPVNCSVEPTIVQFVKISKSRQDHSYRDFSIVPRQAGYEPPASIESMSFSEKLHAILSAPENSKTIRWMSHGRAFHVDVPKNMEKQGILMKYFQHGRYSSFLRQLNNHGFKHLTVGPDRNCYYHECFLRGLPHLCSYMPPARDARRLIPDPDNEPNFYAISKSYPLPGEIQEDAKPIANGTTARGFATSQQQQAGTDYSSSPSAVPLPSTDQVSPYVVVRNQGNGQPEGPRMGVTTNCQAAYQPPNGNLMLPTVLANALALAQGTTSITNSLLAAMSQDTLNFFPNIQDQANNNTIAGSHFDNNAVLNLLEALLMRQSKVVQKHDLENPFLGRPMKMPRFDPGLVQVPMTIPAPFRPSSDMASVDRRMHDVAHSIATMEKFRSEAKRLEAERKKTEQLERTATANALAAQADLVAAILSGRGGTRDNPSGEPDVYDV